MTVQKTLHVVALAVLLVASLVNGRPEPYNLCEFECVQAIYAKYCGGTPCVYGSMDGSQQKTLCTVGCLSAIEGEEMYYCLKSQDPLRGDFKLVQQSLAAQIMGKNSKTVRGLEQRLVF